MGLNTGPAVFLQPVYGTKIGFADWNTFFNSILSICGKTVYATQGNPNGLPNYNGLTVTASGMNLTVGGSGNQWVVCDGFICDACPTQAYTVPNNTSGQTRIDAIEIAHVLVQTTTESIEVEDNSGNKTMEPIPVMAMGVEYWYLTGTPGGGNPSPTHGGSIYALVTVPNNATTPSDIAVQFPLLNPQGPAGVAYTTTTAGVVIPAVSASVTVPVVNGVPFPNGAYCVVSDGTHAIHGQVTSGGGTTSLTVQVDAILVGAQGDTIASGATCTPSGEIGPQGSTGATGSQGPAGANGHGSTTSTSTVLVPAVNSSASIPVADATAFPVGEYGLISDGTNAFVFKVTAVAGNSLTVTNVAVTLGASGNTIASSATVTFSGPPAVTSVGYTTVKYGNATSNTTDSITLPNDGGTYVVEATWFPLQSNDMTTNNVTFSLTGGAGLSSIVQSAGGSYTNTFDSSNSNSAMAMIGQATATGQTISFTFSSTTLLKTSPYTIRATRVA